MDETTAITLKFMANSLYQEIIGQTAQIKRPTREDYKFYKKRVFNMTKEMLKGQYPNENIKEEHMHYVDVLIEYMKVQDRTDILQKDYVECSALEKNIHPGDLVFDISESAKGMMKENDVIGGPLDGFVVTKKIIIKEQQPLPIIRVVNIKTEEHKTKGIKKHASHDD